MLKKTKKVLESFKNSNKLILPYFLISVKFYYDLPVFVSTSNKHRNLKIFMFQPKF